MFKIKKEKSGVVESGISLKFEYQGKGFYKGVVLHNGSQISCAFLKEGEDFEDEEEDEEIANPFVV